MKWYKHIADSLDDPFIFELMEKHGSAGYVAFFGILEIYAREFKVADDWKLVVRLSYLKKKLRFYHKKILINCLKTIGSQPEIDQRLTKDRTEIDQRLTKDRTEIDQRLTKDRTEIDQRLTKDRKRLIKDSGKWDVEFNEDMVSIFIPKFKELMDESTLKKLRAIEQSFRNRSGIIPKSGATDVDVDVDKEEDKEKEKEKEIFANVLFPSFFSFSFFELFWDAFDDKRGKETAIQSWLKIPNLTENLCKEIIKGAKQYATERKNILDKGGTPKMAKGWLVDRRWEDEIKDWKEELREKYGN